ncbi:UNVERIFIED_CONTAM: hypothetical protein C7383_11819 [Murimonas intestini]|uniref:Uncharacterized protein n=1 Tax=Murimonas intestini TaxID=1337051 RepID=A0AB73SYC2_9FIRM
MFVKGFGAASSGKKRQPCGVPALTKAWVPTGLSFLFNVRGQITVFPDSIKYLSTASRARVLIFKFTSNGQLP